MKFKKYFLGLGVLLMFQLGCQSLMYAPRKEKLFDPSKVQMIPEDVF